MSTIYDPHPSTTDKLQPSTKQSMVAGIQQSSEECVRDNPVSMAAVAVGVGAAVGLAAVVLLTSGEDRRRRSMIAHLSQQMSNRLGQYLPDSLYNNR